MYIAKKNISTFIAITIFLYLIGTYFLKGLASGTIGAFLRSMLPAFAFGITCYLIYYAKERGINLLEDIQGFSFSHRHPQRYTKGGQEFKGDQNIT